MRVFGNLQVSWCFEPSQPHRVISGLRVLQRYFSFFKVFFVFFFFVFFFFSFLFLNSFFSYTTKRYFCFFLLHNTKKQAVGTHEKASKFIYICSHLKARLAGEVPLAETLRAKRPSVNEQAVSAKTTVINPAAPTVVSFDDRVGTICFGDERCPWIGFQSAVSKISALGFAVEVVSSDSDLFALFCCSVSVAICQSVSVSLSGWLADCLCLSVCLSVCLSLSLPPSLCLPPSLPSPLALSFFLFFL